VRITEKELIVYGPDVKETARHELCPSGTTGEKRSRPEHAPGRDHRHKYELLKQRFAEFGPEGVVFLDELIRVRRCGKETPKNNFTSGGRWCSSISAGRVSVGWRVA